VTDAWETQEQDGTEVNQNLEKRLSSDEKIVPGSVKHRAIRKLVHRIPFEKMGQHRLISNDSKPKKSKGPTRCNGDKKALQDTCRGKSYAVDLSRRDDDLPESNQKELQFRKSWGGPPWYGKKWFTVSSATFITVENEDSLQPSGDRSRY